VLGVVVGGCYLSHERASLGDDDPPACIDAAPVVSCNAWQPDGAPRRLSNPAAAGDFVQLGSVVPIDCGVLVSWVVVGSAGRTSTVRHFTRTLSLSGEPSGPIEAHPALSHELHGWRALSLAVGPSSVAGLVEAGGRCSFVSLDPRGRPLGAPVEVARDATCRGLDIRGDGFFSFVGSTLPGTGMHTLVAVDETGARREEAELPLPVGRIWGSRTNFEDGSFLSYSFSQDVMTGVYEGWLWRYDGRGNPLGDEMMLGENGVPVHVTPTSTGALATWTTAAPGGQPLRLRPIGRDGASGGPTRDVPAEAALYGAAIESTPDGGALIAWQENHFESEPQWRLRVQSLLADGTPREASTTVMTTDQAETWRVLVDPSGAHPLLVYSSNGNAVDALALRCAR
jgi:hypothetical protein